MMIGNSSRMRQLQRELQACAGCDVTVLLEGETGTGKELAAREIHYASARADHPFVPVNCGALPDALIESELFGHRRGAFTDAREDRTGLVEHAAGGSLFLDEVDSLSPKAQVALLRFLQDRQYRPVGCDRARSADVRIIAATNASLIELSKQRHFRADLVYRLNPLHVRIPALRERGEDIALLAQHLLRAATKQLCTLAKQWHPLALDALGTYPWPGNVRELESVVLRACLRCKGSEVGADDVSGALGQRCEEPLSSSEGAHWQEMDFSAAKSSAIAAFERDYLTALMHRTHGNVTEAARLSKTERRHLGKLLKKRGIEKLVPHVELTGSD